jgi:hypothetical protein
MASIAFALPLKEGKKDAGYKFVDELTGAKSAEHHAEQKMRGLTRVKVFSQKVPAEMIVVYLEGDLQKAFSSGPVAWFADMVEEITGHHPQKLSSGGAPSEILFDWHETHGHAKGREHAHA